VTLELVVLQTLFVLNHYVSARDDAVFPEADRFIPERWLRAGDSTDVTLNNGNGTFSDDLKQRSAFSCLPFGYGNRSCLGGFISPLRIVIISNKSVHLHSP